jgi:hypothetical protein
VVPVNRKEKLTAPTSPRMPTRINPKTDRNFAKRVRLFAGRGTSTTNRLPPSDGRMPRFFRAVRSVPESGHVQHNEG